MRLTGDVRARILEEAGHTSRLTICQTYGVLAVGLDALRALSGVQLTMSGEYDETIATARSRSTLMFCRDTYGAFVPVDDWLRKHFRQLIREMRHLRSRLGDGH